MKRNLLTVLVSLSLLLMSTIAVQAEETDVQLKIAQAKADLQALYQDWRQETPQSACEF